GGGVQVLKKHFFTSSRGADPATATGRIYDRLVARYGKDHVFKDVESMPVGVAFDAYINELIPQCAVVLVVIGRTWLAPDPGTGLPRLTAPDDFVRREIEAALTHQVTVIPVLVEGAAMPSPQELPESIQPLVSQNGESLPGDPYFDAGIRRLAGRVDGYLPPGMRPAIRARRRVVSIGAAIALVLAAAVVLVLVQPLPVGPGE